MIVDIQDETKQLTKDELKRLKRLILFTLETEQLPDDSEVSVILTTDDEIKRLNRDYRQINASTDVLSFPLVEDLEVERNKNIPLLLGDIVISIDTAIEQAKKYNHSFTRELSFLLIHGLLHLLGYTHDTNKDENVMFTKQEEILEAFQIKRT